jgi:hypothetical protein
VHQSIYDTFVQKFVAMTNDYKLGSPTDPETTIGPMVNTDMAAKVRDHAKDALAKGAKQLVDLKKFPMDKDGTPYVAPQVFVNLDHSAKIMTEETFGPVVGIMKVASDAEAVELMNDSEYGLTASVWTADVEKGQSIGDLVETGTVYVNRCDYGDPALAWTGAKYSGRGCSMSKFGFDSMTRVKSYHVRQQPAASTIAAAPIVAAAPVVAAASASKEPSGNYIVAFKKGVVKDVVEKAIKDIEATGGKIKHRYDTVFTGFAATIPDSILGECLRVLFVCLKARFSRSTDALASSSARHHVQAPSRRLHRGRWRGVYSRQEDGNLEVSYWIESYFLARLDSTV